MIVIYISLKSRTVEFLLRDNEQQKYKLKCFNITFLRETQNLSLNE